MNLVSETNYERPVVREEIPLPIRRILPSSPKFGHEFELLSRAILPRGVFAHRSLIAGGHTKFSNVPSPVEHHTRKRCYAGVRSDKVDEHRGPKLDERRHGSGPATADDVDHPVGGCGQLLDFTYVQRERGRERPAIEGRQRPKLKGRVVLEGVDECLEFIIGNIYIHVVGRPTIARNEVVECCRSGDHSAVPAKSLGKCIDVLHEGPYNIAVLCAEDGRSKGEILSARHAPGQNGTEVGERYEQPYDVVCQAAKLSQWSDGYGFVSTPTSEQRGQPMD